MRTSIMKAVSVAFLVALTMALMGCTTATAEEEATTTYEARYGDEVSSANANRIEAPGADEQPDSHQMMAMTILRGAGKEYDLSSYESVCLVDMKLADGSEVTAVVLDGLETVFPASLEGGQ